MKINIFLLSAFILSSCNWNNVHLGDNASIKIPKDSTIAIDSNIVKANALDNEEILKKEDKLNKDFLITKDDFKGITFFKNKYFGKDYWPDRICIFTYFNSNGNIFLVSNFYSDDWIFHTSITALIDGQARETNIVPTYNEWNKTTNTSEHIWENVSYIDDKEIIEWLANNFGKQIKIRFNGKQYYHDITLTDKDKKAIQETWDLYKLKFPYN